MRREHDCLGERELQDDVYYGVQTLRAMENFSISGIPAAFHELYIDRLIRIKRAAAKANLDCGALDAKVAGAIVTAAGKLLEENPTSHFPLDIFQGGGYTSLNMNMNEVLAHFANVVLTGHKGYDAVHPNTHVNMGQSTNDVMPSAMRLFCAPKIDALVVNLGECGNVLRSKAAEFSDVVKIGRTCLQDALPVTLGQEFGGYACLIERHAVLLRAMRPECFTLTVGGTAVGTGLGAASGYARAFYRHLAEDLGEEVRQEHNLFDGMQNADFYLRLHGLVKSTACSLSKIARDMRLLSSGPRAGLGEITLPAVQAGSSIMPGKINPVMPEVMIQVAYQICGNDTAVTMAAEGGELDLNVWEPVFLKNVGESFLLLTNVVREFSRRCLSGVTANRKTCAEDASRSLALATVTAATLGYEEGVRVARYAEAEGVSIRDAVLALKVMNEKDAEALLDPLLLTDSGKSARLFADWKRNRRTECLKQS